PDPPRSTVQQATVSGTDRAPSPGTSLTPPAPPHAPAPPPSHSPGSSAPESRNPSPTPPQLRTPLPTPSSPSLPRQEALRRLPRPVRGRARRLLQWPPARRRRRGRALFSARRRATEGGVHRRPFPALRLVRLLQGGVLRRGRHGPPPSDRFVGFPRPPARPRQHLTPHSVRLEAST
ncbi:hypothetical protein MUK42_14391, partial [Musa troglodytarum]